MYDDSSLARNSAVPTASAGDAIRPREIREAIASAASTVGMDRSKVSVRNGPHTIALTRTPLGPSSCDAARVSAFSPALAAA